MRSTNMISFILNLDFLYIASYKFSTPWSYIERDIPYSMLRYITNGKARFKVDDKAFNIEKDDIIYFPEGSSIECYALGGTLEFLSIRFFNSSEKMGTGFSNQHLPISLRIKAVDDNMREVFFEILSAFNSQEKGKNYIVLGQLYSFDRFAA
ncbi:hypothetical protein RWE15_05710 [Virgibacillus halophilus]|uniref:AraC-type arabinose-binding/dimerisation domain-containing protein n=1 Tax=Tigheibacillus halophilus TaxID=361280 RepID=A0ABU5C440_9BACI|nr:hypothetical protein [Virgibacillus halophilus]